MITPSAYRMATTVVPCVTCRGGSPPPPPPSTGTSLPTRLSNSLKLGPGSPAPGNNGRLIRRKPTRLPVRILPGLVPLRILLGPPASSFPGGTWIRYVSLVLRREVAGLAVVAVPVSHARRPVEVRKRLQLATLRAALHCGLHELPQM